MLAQAVIETNALRNLDDVGADGLADVRDLVDERDAGHQERVRRELDHLRRGHVGDDDRRVDSLVQRLHLRSVLLCERADHDPIGIDEVVDRAALGKELGVRHITDVRETAGLERSANLLAGPDRNGRLHDEHAPPLDAREVV